MTTTKGAGRPAIIMAATEAERLSAMAVNMTHGNVRAAELLLEEIDRAEVRGDDAMPADVVTMNSEVEFVDEARGATRTVRLVYPCDADIAANRVSIFTPVGAGLIGLSPGQSITWPDRDGHARVLRVVRVAQPR